MIPDVDNVGVVEVLEHVNLVHNRRGVLDELLGDDPGELAILLAKSRLHIHTLYACSAYTSRLT